MRRIALAAVVVTALISPKTASAYSFGDWASDQGYSPGDAMPDLVDARLYRPRANKIDSLEGISDYDWTTSPTTSLSLRENQISSIESGDFNGLTNLTSLDLRRNQLSSIEAGDFEGLTTLRSLGLGWNQISSVELGAFNGLTSLTELHLWGNELSSIESGSFSGLTNLTSLSLGSNQISSIDSGDFDGPTNLTELRLWGNELSSIESGAFSGLMNLRYLDLSDNTVLTALNLAEADFSSLNEIDVSGNDDIVSVSLKNTVLNQTSLESLLDGGLEGKDSYTTGIGELDGITEMDLSGIDFADITDLSVLYKCDGPFCDSDYLMHDLTDLWLVNTRNLDAVGLDVLLDNLASIEGTDTEGVLYITQADFDAFNIAGGGLLAAWDAELGHHVAIIPEPSTLLLFLVALGMAGGRGKRNV